MKRVKDISEIRKKDHKHWITRIEIEDHLTAEDVMELKNSLDNTIKNLTTQIKQGKEQIKQLKSSIKAIELKKKDFLERKSKARKHFEEAEAMLPKKVANVGKGETNEDNKKT